MGFDLTFSNVRMHMCFSNTGAHQICKILVSYSLFYLKYEGEREITGKTCTHVLVCKYVIITNVIIMS